MSKKENQKLITQKQYCLTVEGQDIPVSEEVYRCFKRPEWAEHKRKERAKRCIGDNGHRCTGDCSKCDRQKNGAPLSLETLEDASGNPLPTNEDVAEIVMYSLLLEKLYEELDKLAPTDELILRLFSHGKSEREIAQILRERSQSNPAIKPLSQKSVNLHKTSLFATLREQLKDYR